ncbi:MAG TPA: hypothetical protein VM537_32230 [Anaerolineae bacterium]|nr:hypothetical protein [Anaerolineae bacterium]
MPRIPKKVAPKGSQPGKRLTEQQKEAIFQMFLLTGNKTEVARRMGLSDGAVRKHLKIVANETDPEFQAARRAARLELQGKVQAKAHGILDSISAQDLESGRLDVRDGTGQIVRVIEYGPSLMAKVTAHAILVDKVKVIEDMNLAIDGEDDRNALLTPDTIAALVSGLRGKLKSIAILKADFATEQPDLSQRIQSKLEEATLVEPIEILSMDSLDGND